MKTSEKIDQVLKALFAMQQEFGVMIPKDRTGNYANYAGLPCILTWIKDNAGKHGLMLDQPDCIYEGKNAIENILWHIESGQFISSMSLLTPAEGNKSPDQLWSASTTTHRRYGAMNLLGLFQHGDPTDNEGEVEDDTEKTEDNNVTTNFINENQVKKYWYEASQHPDEAATIATRYPDPTKIPKKEFQKVLNYLDPKKYPRE